MKNWKVQNIFLLAVSWYPIQMWPGTIKDNTFIWTALYICGLNNSGWPWGWDSSFFLWINIFFTVFSSSIFFFFFPFASQPQDRNFEGVSFQVASVAERYSNSLHSCPKFLNDEERFWLALSVSLNWLLQMISFVIFAKCSKKSDYRNMKRTQKNWLVWNLGPVTMKTNNIPTHGKGRMADGARAHLIFFMSFMPLHCPPLPGLYLLTWMF